ncbi:MAG: hypothetical protein WBY28_13085, partial [Nitrososphaeraceae archaeon]
IITKHDTASLKPFLIFIFFPAVLFIYSLFKVDNWKKYSILCLSKDELKFRFTLMISDYHMIL